MKCSKCGLELVEHYDVDQKEYWVHPGAAFLEVCLMKQGIIKKLVVREKSVSSISEELSRLGMWNPMGDEPE